MAKQPAAPDAPAPHLENGADLHGSHDNHGSHGEHGDLPGGSGWTAGLAVESAADIASGEGRFSMANGDEMGWAPPPAADASRYRDDLSAIYEVRARHLDSGWELRIGGAGMTMSPTLAGAELMARTYVSLLHQEMATDAIPVHVIPELEGDLGDEVVRSRTTLAHAEEAMTRAHSALAAAQAELDLAQAERHKLTGRLRDAGLSEADTAAVILLT